jgi:hypothetical protein
MLRAATESTYVATAFGSLQPTLWRVLLKVWSSVYITHGLVREPPRKAVT